MKYFSFYDMVAHESRHSVSILVGAFALLERFGQGGGYVLSDTRYFTAT